MQMFFSLFQNVCVVLCIICFVSFCVCVCVCVNVYSTTAANPSDGTMAVGSTQPLTEMSTRSISWG